MRAINWTISTMVLICFKMCNSSVNNPYCTFYPDGIAKCYFWASDSAPMTIAFDMCKSA